MLRHPDADKSKGKVIEERDMWRSRYEALQKRYKQEVDALVSAFGLVLIEASQQGVKMATPPALAIHAKRLEQYK